MMANRRTTSGTMLLALVLAGFWLATITQDHTRVSTSIDIVSPQFDDIGWG